MNYSFFVQLKEVVDNGHVKTTTSKFVHRFLAAIHFLSYFKFLMHVKHLNRQNLTSTKHMRLLKRVVKRRWSPLFASITTIWSNNILIPLHYIWLGELLLSNRPAMNSGLNLWKHGRLPKRWYIFFFLKTKAPALYILLFQVF